MAHNATINELVSGLITATTGRKVQEPSFRKIKERATKALKTQNVASTNHFAVQSKLDGLVEKFGILNRDDLADALETRLVQLDFNAKGTPEALSLLLLLSNNPAVLIHRGWDARPVSHEDHHESITWSQMLAEEPVDEAGIWDDIERGFHSSGDDDADYDRVDGEARSSKATSIADDDNDADVFASTRRHLLEPSEAATKNVSITRRTWTDKRLGKSATAVTEIALVRETLMMIHGLPTEMYRLDGRLNEVSVSRRWSLATASRGSISDFLTASSQYGTTLNTLRYWSKAPQPSGYVQSMQAEVRTQLKRFDADITSLEQKMLDHSTSRAMSCVSVLATVRGLARPLLKLTGICMRPTSHEADASQFALLNALYDESCASQIVEDLAVSEVLTAVLLAGVITYLRLVASWIVEGIVSERDADIFFVDDIDQNCNWGSLWHDRFQLRTTAAGVVQAPKLLIDFVHRIFAYGKSRAFFRLFDTNDITAVEASYTIPPSPNFSNTIERLHTDQLLPLSELLRIDIDLWLSKIGTGHLSSLRSKLFFDCGMAAVLVALPYIFFAKDGSLFQQFAGGISKYLTSSELDPDSGHFILTDCALNTIASRPEVHSSMLRVSYDLPLASSTRLSQTRRLGFLRLTYTLSWPIQNVIRSRNPETHSKAASFILQILHALACLQQQFPDLAIVSTHVPKSFFALRHRLYYFLHVLQSHITAATYSLHGTMMTTMSIAADIDAMVTIWADYERRLQTSLFLGEKIAPIRDTILQIFEVCERLADVGGTRMSTSTSLKKVVEKLTTQFDSSLLFLVSSVRGIGRASGETSLEMFAERLEWAKGAKDALTDVGNTTQRKRNAWGDAVSTLAQR